MKLFSCPTGDAYEELLQNGTTLQKLKARLQMNMCMNPVCIISRLIVLIMILSAFFSCNPDNQDQNTTDNQTSQSNNQPVIPTPVFNQDSAYLYVQQQVDFGPRVPETDAHKACALYLENKLKAYGADVLVQQQPTNTYDGRRITMKNIIGQFNVDKANRILLFAHWDSRHIADKDDENTQSPILGANDGASGVGVLLEVARQLQLSSPALGIDIIFFDAEDQGNSNGVDMSSWCLGSQHWAKNPHKRGYFARYGILLDMVGGHDAVFAKESHSMRFAPSVVDKVWKTGHRLGYGRFFSYEEAHFVGTDDHVHVSNTANIPSIDIIQYDADNEGFAPYWHTHDDNMDAIDPITLKAVGQTLLEVIYTEK